MQYKAMISLLQYETMMHQYETTKQLGESTVSCLVSIIIFSVRRILLV